MDPPAVEFNPHSVETEVVALWKARHQPPTGGVLGPPGGPAIHQFEGNWTVGDFPALVAYRAVTADVDARYLALAGRRVVGTLRQSISRGPALHSPIPALLTALGVWTGGDGPTPWDAEDRTVQVQAIVGRLARKEILVTRDEAFRMCPTCGMLRSPERTIYDEREGDTYLVRFPLRIRDLTVNALVWVDAPWKLLGASALLLNPNLRYVVAGYHRREDRELVLTSAPSLDRLRAWIPESTLEVVEERPGREYHGLPYTYPLRHEFPMGGELAPPAGTLLGAADVGESGTGIVPLVPGHGPTDARIADRLGVTGWPLLTPGGRLDFTLMHKYAGLDLETANEFVVRDLSEAGALLARLRVKRGVPYCSICGTALLWAPARAWCLEPSRLLPERGALFSRLLPHDSFPGQGEVAPWPVSESVLSEDPRAVALLECKHCDRLDAPDGPPQCPCGARRGVVRRRILPSIGAALAAWARTDPFPEGDSAHLYVGQRRRVPTLVHHLAALSGMEGTVADVTLTVVPTVTAADLTDLVRTYGADVVRTAVVRSGISESAGARFSDLCRREADRLRRWWGLSREVVALCDRATIAELARPIGGYLGELEVEDRAIVARWERVRVLALAQYDHRAPGLAYRRVAAFLDNELVEYRGLVRPRLALAGASPSKRSALRTLVHLLRGTSEVLAPIVPFLAEAIHRSLSAERASLFERPVGGVDRSLLNDDLVTAWGRWHTMLRSVDRFRRSLGIPRAVVLPSLVLVVPADDVADRLRAEKPVLARLLRVDRIEVGSPREPWNGRQRLLRPVESEIQKVYPTQASQIVHLLQRMTTRPRTGGPGEEELSVVIDGYPVRVFPAMVSVVETLPKRVVPVPWSLGEMYAELPANVEAGRGPLPPLSSDAFWLVRRLERRLRASPPAPGQALRLALATVKDPLASELRSSAEPIARYLDLGELRVVEAAEEAVPPNAVTGRTRTGDRWWVHVPGLPVPPPREKRPHPGPRLQRVSVSVVAGPKEEVDYSDPTLVTHAEAVRALGQELDDIVGIPLLGPSKIAAAWDQGLHSVDDLRRAPFEVISAIPGFGAPVAEVVVSKIGGTVPAREGRIGRRRGGGAPLLRIPPTILPSPPPALSATPAPTSPSSVLPLPASSLREPAVAAPAPLPPEIPSLVLPTETSAPEAPLTPPHPPPSGPGEISGPSPSRLAPAAVPVAETAVREPLEEAPERPVVAPAPMVRPLEEPVALEMLPAVPAPVPEPREAPVSEEPETLPEVGGPPASASVPETEIPEVLPEAPPAGAPPESIPPPIEVSAVPVEESPAPSPHEAEAPAPVEVPVPEELPIPEEGPPPSLAPEPTTPLPRPTEGEVEVAPATEEAPVSESPAAPPTEPEGERVPEAGPVPIPPSPEVVATVPPLISEPGPTAPEREGEEPLSLAEGPVSGPTPSLEKAVVAAPEAAAAAPIVPEEAPPLSIAVPLPEAPPETAPPTEPVPAMPKVEPSPGPSAVAPPVPPTPVVTVTPPAPAILPEPEPPLPPSGVELIVGEPLFVALGGFLDSTSAGHHGVCVVRESPERIRARVGFRPIEVFWLSNIGRGPSLRPADLEGLWTFLARKLTEERATAFFLEGLEYLVRLHGADAVLTGLVQFDRLARENDARVWVCLTPALMKPSDIDHFRATFGTGLASS